MFKEATIYRISSLPACAHQLAEALKADTFTPTAPTQKKATGWEPPRAAHGALVENIGCHWIARFTTETRTVPADAVQDKAAEVVRKIEHLESRIPGARERRDIAAEDLLALLPQAFPRQSSVPVWIDPVNGLLIIGSAASGKVDAIVTSLVRCTGANAKVQPLQTRAAPAAAMAAWLADASGQALPAEFSIGRECELQGTGDDAPVLRFNRYDIENSEDVRGHIKAGMEPTRLGLDWQGVVSFVLTNAIALRKIKAANVTPPGGQEEPDAFDADVAIATGTLAPLIQGLIAALGGEPEQQPL